MDTFSAVIDRWPEPAPVTLAADLGEETGTVRQWRNRNVLPDRVWLSVVEAADRRSLEGVSLELLASIARARTAKPPSGRDARGPEGMSGTECRAAGEDKPNDQAV